MHKTWAGTSEERKEIKIANKPMKQCFVSASRKIPIKTTVNYHIILNGLAQMKKFSLSQVLVM